MPAWPSAVEMRSSSRVLESATTTRMPATGSGSGSAPLEQAVEAEVQLVEAGAVLLEELEAHARLAAERARGRLRQHVGDARHDGDGQVAAADLDLELEDVADREEVGRAQEQAAARHVLRLDHDALAK